MDNKKDKQVALVTDVVVSSPIDNLLIMAMDKDFDKEGFKMLVEMKKEHENDQRRVLYNAAMVQAQMNMPIVPKDQYNGHTKSKYSSYEMILKHTQPVYTGKGFAITMYEGVTTVQDNIRICADVMHEGGHTEKLWVDIGIDNKGSAGTVNKTGPHAKKSSISYARGILMCTIFNIPTGDGDDGNLGGGLKGDYITDEQAMTVHAILEEIGTANIITDKFLSIFNATRVEQIPAKRYNEAVRLLNERRESL